MMLAGLEGWSLSTPAETHSSAPVHTTSRRERRYNAHNKVYTIKLHTILTKDATL